MSVICQNFVQNAWKKDLCSNCFKSVGDHDITETIATQNEIQIQNQSETLRYGSQAPNSLPCQTNSTPHTTWKTLISEKNSKNTQPFKLETGFQGRLLTINKASHGIEKKIDSKTNLKNGQLSNFAKSASTDDLTKTNGHSTKPNGPHSKTNGYHSVQNGNGYHHTEDVKIVHNGVKPTSHETNGKSEKSPKQPQRECQENGVHSKPGERRTQSKLVKSKSEDTLSTPLHGILKKTVSSPANSPSRRAANVGFKDEKPLVIGYGGRDFSPEELEWDMNVSDIDNGSDSLDETEDDKLFSKMTRQNTEFNSDNANLLKKNLADSDSNKTRQQEQNLGAQTSSQQTARAQKESNSSEERSDHPGKAPAAKPDSGALHHKMDVVDKQEEGNGDEGTAQSRMQTEGSIISNQTISGPAIGDNNGDSVNVTMKSDKSSSFVVPTGEVGTVVTAEEDTRVERGDQNSSASVNEARPPSRSNPPQNTDSITTTTTLENSEMFSDGEEQVGRNAANTLPDEENNEWQDDDDDGGGLAGQILQAINTSLTNRHKMNEEPVDLSREIKTAESKEQTPTADITSDAPVLKIESWDEEAAENGISVEPRTSFLHGISTNNKKSTKPSAIYGPASDLFVSRSDSSSSSSSDEFNKSEGSHFINVIVNGESSVHQQNGNSSTDTETEETVQKHRPASSHENNSLNVGKTKPEVPAKPAKPQKKLFIPKSKSAERNNSDSSDTQNGYYSVGNASPYPDSPKSISLVDHYAESNIYHEVGNTEMKLPEDENFTDKSNPRESKLAALAMELEQVRHCNGNTKRQAPAPPKVPEPPLEDPPNSSGRASPLSVDSPHGFASFRGEAMAFSSSSSTASTSSQDTETGYASWNIHGDLDDQRKHSKSKSSFLLTQYSKCKKLAMGYAEDSAKSRKKFSLKKLLKIQKDNEAPAAFDPNCPNPKAWKYSDHFERPRAKLEIIHPMDLENRNVTVNPGFDSLHSGSMSSFTASADDLSLRNSVSSDYGSFYSDTISPIQDLKSEVNYECIPQRHPNTSDEQEDSGETNARCGSNSPTPSRTSSVSQASTLTSGSSKNGGASPNRPPKPPPPPRAHSLLPGNKALNADGTFKFPVPTCSSVGNSESSNTPTKPQAPKRQCKSTPQRTDYGIYDNTIVEPAHMEVEQLNEDRFSKDNRISFDGNTYGTILDVRVNNCEKLKTETLEDTKGSVSSEVLDEKESEESQPPVQEPKVETQSINVSVKVKPVPEPMDKITKNVITRNKHSPITRAPARPPPIYMKSQISNVVKNPNPWKTLEDSYLVLTASNRELLIKLVNQALKKRKNYVSQLQKLEFQWSDFEIDVDQPSSVFAFGEKIAYHATMPKYPEFAITLVVTVQQQHNRMIENGDLKYPVFGQFVDYIPKELLEENYANDAELESMQATVLVLDRSNISTIECFSENLPSSLTEENEKELCFIILQLIHSLKSLQAHGIESIDSSFQNLILAKSKNDKYNTLVFLSDSCYDENDYLSDSCKISLCQYALMLLFQLLGIQSAEEFFLPPAGKFSSEMSRKVFETAVSLLSEEKAVSLSQTKTLFECFLWEVMTVIKKLDESDDVDSVLHRWLDIKRSNYIKNMFDDESVCDINIQSEYLSQFLIRTSVRNVKEVVSYL